MECVNYCEKNKFWRKIFALQDGLTQMLNSMLQVIAIAVVRTLPQAPLSLRQSRHFQRLRIVTYSLPLAKNTSQGLTWLRRPTSTCSFTTISNFPPCFGKTACMIYFPTNFECILPNPILLVFIPLTVKFLFTYRAGLICQGTCWSWDRGIRLGS